MLRLVERRQGSRVWVALGTLLCLALPLGVAAFPNGSRLIVVAAPGSKASALMEIIGAADGRLLASTRFDWMALASGEGADFAGRLSAAGAWMVLDGSLFRGCETKGLANKDKREQGT